MKHFIGYNPSRISVTPYQYALHSLFSSFQKGAFHPYAALRLSGMLDEVRLARAAESVVRQNDALRSYLRQEEDGLALYVYDHADYALEIIDCSTEEEVNADISTRLNRSYTTEDDVLFTMKLYRLNQTQHIFFVMISHVVSDGESVGAMIKKLLSCYMDEQFSDHETTHSMAMYNQEELAFYASDAFRANCNYWHDRVSFDYPQYLEPQFPELTAEMTEPYFVIPIEQLRQCMAKYRCTGNLLMMTAYHLTLCRMLRQSESSFFFMYGNRTRPEYADLIAPQFQVVFSKLRADTAQSCGELVRGVLQQFTEGMQYAHGCLLSFPLKEAMETGGLGCILTYNQMMPEMKLGDLVISNHNKMFDSMKETVLACNLLMLACNETQNGVLVCPVLAVNDKIDKPLFQREFRAVFTDTVNRLSASQDDAPFFTAQEL